MKQFLKKKSGPRFAKAFKALLQDPRISPSAKTLLFLLKAHADQNGRCYPSLKTICGCLGASRNSVLKWLKELTHHRLIRIEQQHIGAAHLNNIYWIEDEYFVKLLAKPFRRVVQNLN